MPKPKIRALKPTEPALVPLVIGSVLQGMGYGGHGCGLLQAL